ncbi:MAG: cyclic nucleotide-binding domain-containing protein [Candidatus Tectomicrobia bacterium]|uniref:Cyclic nucleotide-binding domain-containing protein n=1 Tax=Tectimicrobiota bacterium TaxID=2528274 RepID=A0A932GPT7_UNCTE|nr:cyclic nucleotide-binding domain-containing protein [Candidatus Tectomicrobia bacterium]
MEGIHHEEKFKKGDVILREGSVSDAAYMVLSGKVEVSRQLDGKRVIIEQLSEGEIFGEMGLISKGLRSATVTAIDDLVVGVIDYTTFDEKFANLPRGVRLLIESLVKRVERTSKHLSTVAVHLDKAKKMIDALKKV